MYHIRGRQCPVQERATLFNEVQYEIAVSYFLLDKFSSWTGPSFTAITTKEYLRSSCSNKYTVGTKNTAD